MSQSETFSDEHLNAFIDGELDDDERDQLLDLLRRDKALNARVCDLQKVRELLQHAYRKPPQPPRRGQPPEGNGLSRFSMGIAASVILGLGITVGWNIHEQQHPQGSLLDIAQSIQLAPAQVAQADPANPSAAAESPSWRVVLHVTTADPYRLKTVLDEAEGLLRQHTVNNHRVAVEVLANGRGLNLLRADTSPFADRIRELQSRYADTLAFKACQNAINRLKLEKNIDVILLPEASVVPTAIGEVILRQREGWAYVQI